MLEPGVIPTSEPMLRVGIILPEDRYTSLTLQIPETPGYQLECSGRSVVLSPGSELFFKYTAQGIVFEAEGRAFTAPSEIQIFPQETISEPAPGQGILIKNVISGRDFHWKKYINVTYSGTIILRRHEDRLIVINELPIEHYLMCVATSEMGAACPEALIEAQTIAARSWMLANVEQKHVQLGMDVCNDDCCQRYQGTTFLTPQSVKGALNTYGQVLIYNDAICDARYSKSCGGVMEAFENIWPGKAHPYLQVKADNEDEPGEWHKPLSDEINFKFWVEHTPDAFCSPQVIPENELGKYLGSVDEDGHYYRWQEVITQDDLKDTLKRFHHITAAAISDITILRRGGSGRVLQLRISYPDAQGDSQELILDDEFAIRQTMHKKFLYSSAFTVEKTADQNFILRGAGWGHGVGLCQIGALGMSLKGYNSSQIVYHYYPGSVLKKIY